MSEKTEKRLTKNDSSLHQIVGWAQRQYQDPDTRLDDEDFINYIIKVVNEILEEKEDPQP